MKVLISSDTSCVVSYEGLKKYNISVFPLNVIVDGEEFLDGVTINQDQLCSAMRGNKRINTSTPPLGDVIEYFEKLLAQGYDHIIHFTISSKLSSMNQLFNNVAKEHFAGRVTIIDSYGLSATMFSHVLYAYDEVQKGTCVEKIVAQIEERKKNDYIVFIPENLDALKNGGRISPAIAVIGNMLGIKPLINLADGELQKDSMVRNTKKTMCDKFDESLTVRPQEEFDYTIIAFDAQPSTYNYVMEHAQNALASGSGVVTGLIPINVCAHCGPGTIGLVVSQKINGKSINDFIN